MTDEVKGKENGRGVDLPGVTYETQYLCLKDWRLLIVVEFKRGNYSGDTCDTRRDYQVMVL